MKPKSIPKIAELTNREREIILYLIEGLSTKQIAAELAISAKTVSNHRENMLKKFGVKNSVELVMNNIIHSIKNRG